MAEIDSDLIERQHREAAEALQARKDRQRAQVEALFEQAVQRQEQQLKCDPALVEPAHRDGVERDRTEVLPLSGPPRGVHYTELPEATFGQPLADEWNLYRRQVGRWLGEGRGGRHVLITGQDVLGFFDTFESAYEAGLRRFLGKPFFVHAIREEEPHLLIRGINFPWPSSLSR